MYKFRDGYHNPGKLDASKVAEEIDRIRDVYGAATSGNILQYAQNPDSYIHPNFTWDDAAAADLYRRQEASQMVRAIIQYDTAKSEEVNAFFLARPEGQEAQYLRFEVVVNDSDLFEDAIRRLKSHVSGLVSAMVSLRAYAKGNNAKKVAKAARLVDDLRQTLGV